MSAGWTCSVLVLLPGEAVLSDAVTGFAAISRVLVVVRLMSRPCKTLWRGCGSWEVLQKKVPKRNESSGGLWRCTVGWVVTIVALAGRLPARCPGCTILSLLHDNHLSA